MKTRRGFVKALDELGRVVVPKEMRRTLNINDKDLLEVYIENGRLIIEPFHDCCVICSSMLQLVEHNGKWICQTCIARLKAL